MIEQFKHIENIGRFSAANLDNTAGLKPLTLIYSENGRGKSTLSAILRSLGAADSSPVLSRRRLSSPSIPKAVLLVDGVQIVFDGEKWLSDGPPISVFDEHFVDSNVHSGLTILPGHRQNLHEIIIGDQGIKLQEAVEKLGQQATDTQNQIRSKQAEFTKDILGTLSIDAFCELTPIKDIESELEQASKAVSVLKDSDRILTRSDFSVFALPVPPTQELEEVLGVSLSNIDTTTLATLNDHFAKLGTSSERWVSQGMRYSDDEPACPFCGLALSDSELLPHYRAYFSEAYANHKARIDALNNSIGQTLSGDSLARFQRTVHEQKENHTFWSNYLALPDFTIESTQIASAWTGLREHMLRLVNQKAGAPLDSFSLDNKAREALEGYLKIASATRTLSDSLARENEAIARAKEKAEYGNLAAAEQQLAVLEATRRRYQEATEQLCAEYIGLKAEKTRIEREKEAARNNLNQYRDAVFTTYQTSINGILSKFNADFRIEKLTPSDAKGLVSTSYYFLVNTKTVGTSKSDNQPSFGTVLSSGDRNTLALAFYFAQLASKTDLANTIVVIDDPASSLDEGRTLATVQEIRRLLRVTAQVIVLSHSRAFLCHLWESPDNDFTATLEIVNAGKDSSTIQPWDVKSVALSEYDRMHELLREYANNGTGDAREVASALRPVLEGFLRVSFVDYFPPGSNLGQFLSRAKQFSKDGQSLLSDVDVTELDNLREYANQFHHTDSNWKENLSNINETALKGFAQRTVQFTYLGRRQQND